MMQCIKDTLKIVVFALRIFHITKSFTKTNRYNNCNSACFSIRFSCTVKTTKYKNNKNCEKVRMR